MSKKIIFTGRVQGVGFRYTMHRISGEYAVTGYVKNLPDGTVEALVQGTSKTIDTFIDDVAKQMERNITRIDLQAVEKDDQFKCFAIAY